LAGLVTGIRCGTGLTGAAVTPGFTGRRTTAVFDGQLTPYDASAVSIRRILRVAATQLRRYIHTGLYTVSTLSTTQRRDEKLEER